MASIQTKEEAISLLERYRTYVIDVARYTAYLIARRDGTVHSRQVRAAMERTGRLPTGDERWMGAAFADRNLFEWTGEMHPVGAASPRTVGGGGGGRDIRVWRLRRGAFAPPQPTPWEGDDPGGFPGTPSSSVFQDGTDEIDVALQLACALRQYSRAREQHNGSEILASEAEIHRLVPLTGQHIIEAQQIMCWAAWKVRNAKKREDKK